MKLLIVMAALAAASPALAQEGTASQRAACTPDVIRLCHPGIADALNHSRVIACIKANAKKLSPACRAALSHR